MGASFTRDRDGNPIIKVAGTEIPVKTKTLKAGELAILLAVADIIDQVIDAKLKDIQDRVVSIDGRIP